MHSNFIIFLFIKLCIITCSFLQKRNKKVKKKNNMDNDEFKQRGKEMIDYICKYLDTIGGRRVTPSVEPGYLRSQLPDEAPYHPDEWDDIMADVDSKIMPGVTHWQHPRFHAYFPSGNSFPSILGDMLSDAIGCIGFSWVICILLLFFF